MVESFEGSKPSGQSGKPSPPLVSPPVIRKIRNEGIFYHTLKPAKPEDTEEIRQAVKCAFENISHHIH
jgi:hypothetical protein